MTSFKSKSRMKPSQAKSPSESAPSRGGLSAKASASPPWVLVDHRPETAAQRALQKMANNSPIVKAQADLQAMINNSPKQVAERQRIESIFGQPTQLKTAPAAAQRQEDLEDDALLQGRMAPVQRQGELDEDELVQGRFGPVQRQGLEDEDPIQGKIEGSAMPAQRQSAGDGDNNRTGMPNALKDGLEQLSGMDLSDVRVHRNSAKPAQLNALAYAQGQDIHLGPGQEQHLPHEGWHAVQQMQGRVKPTVQAKGVAINDDEGLEREADMMGTKAAVHLASNSIESFPIHPNASAAGSSIIQCNATSIMTITDNGEQSKFKESNGGTWTISENPAYGSGTNSDVREPAKAAQAIAGGTWVAGHMLNAQLGGSGMDPANITAFTQTDNSKHHSEVESSAKAAVKTGTITYWTVVTKRCSIAKKDNKARFDGLACELQAGWFNGKTGVKKTLGVGRQGGGFQNTGAWYNPTLSNTGLAVNNLAGYEMASRTISSYETLNSQVIAIVETAFENDDEFDSVKVKFKIPGRNTTRSFDLESLVDALTDLIHDKTIEYVRVDQEPGTGGWVMLFDALKAAKDARVKLVELKTGKWY